MRPRAFPLVPFAFVLSGLVLGLQYRPRPLAAQNSSASPDSNPLTATLLKRLGSAVDGYRDGQERWVVISIKPPHTILGVVTSLADANNLLPRGPSFYRVEGPYVAPSDSAGVPRMLAPICKNMDTSSCHTIDSLPPIPINRIRTIEVTFRFVDGSSRTTVYKADSVEAVFFTLSAIDKLLVPYYTVIYGVTSAQHMRQEYFDFFTGARH